jgi:hypothetical protein
MSLIKRENQKRNNTNRYAVEIKYKVEHDARASSASGKYNFNYYSLLMEWLQTH